MGTSGEGTAVVAPIGLDGVYRMSTGDHGFPVGQRAYWEDAATFVLERDEIANQNASVYRMHFDDDRMLIEGRDRTREVGVEVRGRLEQL